MPTQPKPFSVLTTEKKSHRTKAELNLRKKGEEALSSNEKIKVKKEVKSNKVAYKEFKRITNLLSSIDKNDAIYENVINRYCLLYAECLDFETKREKFYENMLELEVKYSTVSEDEMSVSEYFNLKTKLQKTIIDLDKQVQNKRKMMLEIEKENVMTIVSALRSIPKKADKDENPLAALLRGGKYASGES